MASAFDQLADILRGRAPSRPDWDRIIALANRALITPRLDGRLAADAPADLAAFVAEVADRNRQRNQRLYAQLGEAVAALNAAGLTPLVLKGGAVLARTGGHCPRLVSDLDLMVPPQHIDRAVIALQQAGFALLSRVSGADRHALATLGRAADVGEIDLHQRPPGPPSFVDRPNIRDAWLEVQVGSGRVRVSPPHIHLYLQALHDQFHDRRYWLGGVDLRHAWDIADLIAGGGVDWRRLAALPPTRLARHALAAQLAACRQATGAPIPPTAAGGWRGALHARRQRLQDEAGWLSPTMSALAVLSHAVDFTQHWRADRQGRVEAGLPPAGSRLAHLVEILVRPRKAGRNPR